MDQREISREQMAQRVAWFRDLKPSAVPLLDAVLPPYRREILSIIGSSVTEDADVRPAISAVEGFHLSIVRAAPGKGTALHNHKTVEVFMPLTGRWSFQWGGRAENEITLGQYDVVSIPHGVMRGFRNEGEGEALLLVIVGGTDPGRVAWNDEVLDAAKAKGFGFDPAGNIVGLGES